MFSIETQGKFCSIVGEGDVVILDVDALVTQKTAYAVARLILEDRTS